MVCLKIFAAKNIHLQETLSLKQKNKDRLSCCLSGGTTSLWGVRRGTTADYNLALFIRLHIDELPVNEAGLPHIKVPNNHHF